MNVRAEFERNRFAPPIVDKTGFSVLTVWAETFTTLGLWLQSFRRLRLTSPNTATQIATFVSSSSPPSEPNLDGSSRFFQLRRCRMVQSGQYPLQHRYMRQF